MKIVSLIQARMSSSRLPGKVLLPLGDATVLEQVVRRARRFSDQVVVCTSIHEEDNAVETFCQTLGVVCVRGPLDDVFSRFRQALLHPDVNPSEYFVRITADSPLLSVELGHVLSAELVDGIDYLRTDYRTIPLGTGMEFVRTEAFLAIDPTSLDAAEKEHVTLTFYEKEGRYTVKEIPGPSALAHPAFRLTLDYQEDYDLLVRIFGEFEDPTTRDVIELLEARPDWAAMNATCGQRPARSEE